ncbi:hypothetical protein DXT99_08145 [Pontibacter diazotrophicus]|uniref:Uncharacterized protein n=1 Tax=Pontibacter diazotrophicus TaxID=1400979 RepID=A0A3D8LDT0_9BACT|nr:hypothetical protein [Pontibacter diazotrophicus]RDV15456.1 hypothetical protein DXT99_08145 [Pontibacter diazotrophicus]
MSERTGFLNNLDKCNLVVLTPVSKDRTYCRFFLDGLYMDRMYVSDPALVAKLSQLSGKGEEISTGGVARLKQLFMGVAIL